MAVGEKKPIKGELKAYPLKEMGKEARDFITHSKDLSKKFDTITWSKTADLDPRKWNKKSLADGLLSVARYELKVLAVRAAKIAKEAKSGGDVKKLEKELGKDYDDVKKEVIDKVSLAFDEVEADKGDNKKSLKDCKQAFANLDKCDFDTMYSGPRGNTQWAFEELAKALGKGGDGKKAGKALGVATAELTICIKGFAEDGKQATDAVDTLIKAAKTTKADKGVDPELTACADSVLKQESKIASVLANSKTLSDAMEDAMKVLKGDAVDEKAAQTQAAIFKKMSNIDNSAKDTMNAAKKLQPQFQKIEKKLK